VSKIRNEIRWLEFLFDVMKRVMFEELILCARYTSVMIRVRDRIPDLTPVVGCGSTWRYDMLIGV
jgi:hypothetical protein